MLCPQPMPTIASVNHGVELCRETHATARQWKSPWHYSENDKALPSLERVLLFTFSSHDRRTFIVHHSSFDVEFAKNSSMVLAKQINVPSLACFEHFEFANVRTTTFMLPMLFATCHRLQPFKSYYCRTKTTIDTEYKTIPNNGHEIQARIP